MSRVVPTRIGKYQVVGRLAEGPLADVLAARLEGIAGFSRAYVIKHLRPELADQPDALARIEAQAKVAAEVLHGNVVQLLDLGREADLPYLVLEWVDGWSLDAVLAAARAAGQVMPASHAAWIGIQVLKALEYAHQRHREGEGLVHGAVSATNVLVSRAGDVKLADFALARATDTLSADLPELLPRRLDRLAPELLDGADPTVASDLFSVAALLHACVAPTHPFVRDDPEATLQALREGGWPSLATVEPAVPAPFAEVVDRALSLDPAARPATATEMKDALVDLLFADGNVYQQDTLGAWLGTLLGAPTAKIPTSVPSASQELDEGDLVHESDGEDDLVDLQEARERTEEVPLGDDEEARTAADIEEGKTAVTGRSTADEGRTSPLWTEAGQGLVDAKVAMQLAALKASDRDSEGPAQGGVDEAVVAGEAARTRKVTLGVGVLALAAGLVAGVVGGGALQPMVLELPAPVLEVRAPDGGRVTVDGTRASGPVTLSAGRHPVKVEVPDHAPWELELELVQGEYRLLVVERAVLPPADPPAEVADEGATP
ncbi:MAG: serine/threonine protein kinase [Alphaproteobacteria bacterium]|nr:serine/threonine protein kinase [Alphaproteobacteria bacterium]